MYNTNEHQANHLLEAKGKSRLEEEVKGKSLTRDGGTEHTIEKENPKHSPRASQQQNRTRKKHKTSQRG
jgi:hypothetical protein